MSNASIEFTSVTHVAYLICSKKNLLLLLFDFIIFFSKTGIVYDCNFSTLTTPPPYIIIIIFILLFFFSNA